MIRKSFLGIEEVPFEKAEVVILPAPYDAMASWQAGSRNGPAAILDASEQVEFYDEELGKEITSLVKIFTQEPILPEKSKPEAMTQKVEQGVRRVLDAGKIPVLIGGDHSLSIGATLAVAGYAEALGEDSISTTGILHLDAHTDLRESWEGSPFSHASSMRHGIAKGLSLIQVGIRSTDREIEEGLPAEWKKRRVVFFSPHALGRPYAKNGTSGTLPIRDIVNALPKNVYVSIDLDVLDPSIMPAVGTPEPGGITWEEILGLLAAISEARNILGFDVMELAPIPGIHFPEFSAARLITKFLGYIFSATRTQ